MHLAAAAAEGGIIEVLELDQILEILAAEALEAP
jgi:hypothetical protein